MVARRALMVFVEGGGKQADEEDLRECRTEIQAKLAGYMGLTPRFAGVRIAMPGDRAKVIEALKDYWAENPGSPAIALIDAEEPVAPLTQKSNPWTANTRRGLKLKKPKGAQPSDLHFMVQKSEAWFLCCDRAALAAELGKAFVTRHLPTSTSVEDIEVAKLDADFKKAFAQRGDYDSLKMQLAPTLWATLDVPTLTSQSPWAKRFFDELATRLAPTPTPTP